MEKNMRSEQTVLIVGCQPSIERILTSAFQRQGYRVLVSDFFDILPFEKTPNCLLINLEESQCIQARKFLDQPALAYCRRILIIDSHSSRLRQWSIDIPIDDVIFKPVRLRELLTRVKLILEREVTLPGQETTVDELDFAQRMQTLTDERFTGLVHFKAKHVDADLYFVRGTIAGVRVGRKIQKTAVGALWRVFPAVHHIKPKVRLPDWALENPLECDQNQFISIVVRTGGFFHDIFGDNHQLQVIYRINSLEYERVYRDLPRQVRQIIQHFDGERTFEEIMDTLNLDEMLLMQIVRRLLDESLIVECARALRDKDQEVPLSTWIHSGASSAEIKRALVSPQNIEKTNVDLDERESFSSVYPQKKNVYEPGEEATPSSVFFLQNSPYIGADTQKRARAKQKNSEEKRSSASSKALSEQARIQAQKEAILADFSQRMGISQSEVHLTPHASGVFYAPTAEYKHYSRDVVEAHLAKSNEHLQTANSRVQKDTIYSEQELLAEAQRDEEFARLQQAEDEALLNLSIDDSEINEALEAEGPNEPLVPEEDYEEDDEESEEFSAVELYKNNPDHKYELSPEVWKAQIMKRLNEDEQARDEKVMRILIYVLIVVIFMLGAIILYKNVLSNPTTEVVPTDTEPAE